MNIIKKGGKFYTRTSFYIDGKRVFRRYHAESLSELLTMVNSPTQPLPCEKTPLFANFEHTDNSYVVGEALEDYIESKSNILSPSTKRSYVGAIKRFGKIYDVDINELTNVQVQEWVNDLAGKYAPKSVKNTYGLLSATLGQYRPDFKLHITLPQKVKRDIEIPTEEDVLQILQVIIPEYRLAVMLAAYHGLRMSEILGLKWSDIYNGCIHINEARVRGLYGYESKSPKTTAGYRSIKIIPFVADELNARPHKGKYVYDGITEKSVKTAYINALNILGLKYTFHQLRHYYCSVMLSLNIPKNYIARNLGHSTETLIDTVYGHIMERQADQFFDRYVSHCVSINSENANFGRNMGRFGCSSPAAGTKKEGK